MRKVYISTPLHPVTSHSPRHGSHLTSHGYTLFRDSHLSTPGHLTLTETRQSPHVTRLHPVPGLAPLYTRSPHTHRDTAVTSRHTATPCSGTRTSLHSVTSHSPRHGSHLTSHGYTLFRDSHLSTLGHLTLTETRQSPHVTRIHPVPGLTPLYTLSPHTHRDTAVTSRHTNTPCSGTRYTRSVPPHPHPPIRSPHSC